MLYDIAGLSLSTVPDGWSANTAETWDRAREQCEVRVIVHWTAAASIGTLLFYDKRDAGSHGRSIATDFHP